ncbi:MAG: hypothetical protein WBM17_04425 [Anaerolineales bacterium]
MTSKAVEIIQDAIEERGEGLLDDTGVDSKVARSIAEGIVRTLQQHRLLVNRSQPDKHYLVVVAGDVEPSLWGPYPSPEARDQAAKDHRRDDPDKEDGLYTLEINAKGKPEIGSYSGGDLDGDEEEAVEETGGAA